MSDALAIGHRVLVTGLAGSGKSTFSRTLAAKTGLPLIHLDLYFWEPGWVAPSDSECANNNVGSSPATRGSRMGTTTRHSTCASSLRTRSWFSTRPGRYAQDACCGAGFG